MKSQVSISVVHIASGDLWAGAEVQLFTLVKSLLSFENVTVRVILLNHGELENRLRELNIDVEVLDESRLNSLQILWQVRKLLNSWQPNVVHTHRTKENILGGIAARFAGNIPSLRTVHGTPEHLRSWLQLHKHFINTLDWFCGRYVQRKMIAVSDELAEILEKDFPSRKIRVIENGIDLDAIQLQTKHTTHIPSIKGQGFKIGLVGRLVPVKRVDLFIKTACYMRDHNPELETSFYIYGDGPLRQELEDFTHELRVNDIVHFEGHCSHIHQRIKELDILVMTSDHEGLPMTLLEAMALGVPIVAHAVGGIPKLLCEGSCGLLVYKHSETGYFQAIHDLLMNPEQLNNITVKALEQVSNNYTSENSSTTYLSEYYTA